jgi:hypothetical protein
MPETCRVTAEIKPAQCCIKLVFYLTYTMMHGNTKVKFNLNVLPCNSRSTHSILEIKRNQETMDMTGRIDQLLNKS